MRKEKEIVEIDYPIGKVWPAIAKALTSLEWVAQETDEATHRVKAKTKANFMAYASIVTIEALVVNEKATRVNVSAETPVTTITGIVDFGRTRERIDTFLTALNKQLQNVNSEQQKDKTA